MLKNASPPENPITVILFPTAQFEIVGTGYVYVTTFVVTEPDTRIVCVWQVTVAKPEV